MKSSPISTRDHFTDFSQDALLFLPEAMMFDSNAAATTASAYPLHFCSVFCGEGLAVGFLRVNGFAASFLCKAKADIPIVCCATHDCVRKLEV